jgi:hypothetical protein
MTAARRSKSTPVLPHVDEVVLPSGRRLTEGREFQVRGITGRFSFRYVYVPDGSIAAFGPLSSDGRPTPRARLRYFPVERIGVVHNPKGSP